MDTEANLTPPEGTTSPHHRIKAVLAASLGICVGSAAGAILPFFLTHRHGVSRETDVYFIVMSAMQVGAYFIGLVAESSALPVFSGITTRSEGAAKPVLFGVMRQVSWLCLLFNVAALLVVSGVVLPLAGVSLMGADRGVLFVICAAPLPFFAALSGLAAAANYSIQRYAVTTATQAFRAGIALVVLAVAPASIGLFAAAAGLWIGELIRCTTLIAILPRASEQGDQDETSLVARAIMSLAGPTLASSAIIAVNPIVDRSIAAHVGMGAPTVLELAEKTYYIPSVLLVAAISKVYTAQWSRMAAQDPQRMLPDYQKIQKLCLLVGVLASATFAWIATLLLGSRLFAGFHVQVPPEFLLVLIVFMGGLPFAMSADLSNSIIIILRRARVMPRIAIGLVLLNVAGDILGAQFLGVAGIALSSTAVRFASCLAAMYFAVRYLRATEGEKAA